MGELIKIRILKQCAMDVRYLWVCGDGCCEEDEYTTFDFCKDDEHNLELTNYPFLDEYMIEGEFIGNEPVRIKRHNLLDAINDGLIEIIDGR